MDREHRVKEGRGLFTIPGSNIQTDTRKSFALLKPESTLPVLPHFLSVAGRIHEIYVFWKYGCCEINCIIITQLKRITCKELFCSPDRKGKQQQNIFAGPSPKVTSMALKFLMCIYTFVSMFLEFGFNK
jgi:hypothetical protein